MTDEIESTEIEVPGTQVEAQEVTQPEVTLSPAEQRAKGFGWTTKEEWENNGGDPAVWRSAEVWLERGEMLGTINQLKHKTDILERSVKKAFEAGEAMAKARFDDQLAELKAAKRVALAEGDLVKAEDLGEEIAELREKKQADAPAAVPRDVTPPPEFNLFVQRNPWYESDSVKRYTADAIGVEYFNAQKKMTGRTPTPAELYFYVETKMNEKFGHQGERKVPATQVGGNQKASRGDAPGLDKSLSGIKAQMSDEERSIMKVVLNATPKLTEQAYLEEYSKVLKRR